MAPRIAHLLVLAVAVVSIRPTSAQPRVAVADARQLLVAAIDAPDGQAHGILGGELADAITKRFAATSPIHVDVSTERRYAQDGCRRLKVSFSQEDVLLPGEPSARRQTIEFGINYCRDGMPPRSLREVP